MWEPASRGIGRQGEEALGQTALWVRDPRSSQDSSRMWETHSMNSLGLSGKKGGIEGDFMFSLSSNAQRTFTGGRDEGVVLQASTQNIEARVSSICLAFCSNPGFSLQEGAA